MAYNSVSGDIIGTLSAIVAIPTLFAAFISPLQGIHTILQDEKTRLQSDNAQHLEASLGELHHRREAGEYEQIDGVSKAIDSLMKEQTLLKEIPTWPWHPDTVHWDGKSWDAQDVPYPTAGYLEERGLVSATVISGSDVWAIGRHSYHATPAPLSTPNSIGDQIINRSISGNNAHRLPGIGSDILDGSRALCSPAPNLLPLHATEWRIFNGRQEEG